MHEKKFEIYTRYSRVADEEQKKRSKVFLLVILKLTLDFHELQMKKKKGHRCFLENLAADIMRKLYTQIFYFVVLGVQYFFA